MDIDSFKASKDFYASRGYQYMEVPWDCPEKIQQMTIPSDRNIKPSLLDGSLNMVGSAEQSFLKMMLDGDMPEGSYQTITPCFRNDQKDELHQLYFMKLELVSFHWPIFDAFLDRTLRLASDALVFFNSYVKAELIKTDIGYDIISKYGVELGSYGFRQINKSVAYTYGTGLAQPRLNHVIQASKR